MMNHDYLPLHPFL